MVPWMVLGHFWAVPSLESPTPYCVGPTQCHHTWPDPQRLPLQAAPCPANPIPLAPKFLRKWSETVGHSIMLGPKQVLPGESSCSASWDMVCTCCLKPGGGLSGRDLWLPDAGAEDPPKW